MEGDRVVGVVATDKAGRTYEVRAPITLDCTGKEAFTSNRNGWRMTDPYLNKVAVWTYYKDSKRGIGIDEGDTTFRGLRLAAGLSQAGLAARAGLTQSHVALIEGGRNDPTTGTVAKLARALGVTEQLVFRAIRARLERAV